MIALGTPRAKGNMRQSALVNAKAVEMFQTASTFYILYFIHNTVARWAGANRKSPAAENDVDMIVKAATVRAH